MSEGTGIREVRPIFVDSIVALYAYGHLDKEEFLEAAREYLQKELDKTPEEFANDVVHEWWQEVPDTDGFGEWPTLFRSCKPDDPRCYPVTVLNLKEWAR